MSSLFDYEINKNDIGGSLLTMLHFSNKHANNKLFEHV